MEGASSSHTAEAGASGQPAPMITALEAAEPLAHCGSLQQYAEAVADIVCACPGDGRAAGPAVVGISIIIGCWSTTSRLHDVAVELATEHALPGSVLFTGGDMFASGSATGTPPRGPVVAEAGRAVLQLEVCRAHVAFQHRKHLKAGSLYPASTVYVPHDDVDRAGKPVYSGGSPADGSPVGALRGMLAAIAAVCRRGRRAVVRAVFLGGGSVAASELKAVLELGNRGALPAGSLWELRVLPLETKAFPNSPGLAMRVAVAAAADSDPGRHGWRATAAATGRDTLDSLGQRITFVQQPAPGGAQRPSVAAEGFRPTVFVTGGQTGADSIPLTVYRQLGVRVSGYMPCSFKRDDGRGREIAAEHGLAEGEGGYRWRDEANAAQADGLLAFLTTKPRTGKGTMQTANVFVQGVYALVPLTKPADADFVAITPGGKGWPGHGEQRCQVGQRPVLVLWDIAAAKLGPFAEVLRGWLAAFRPARLMVAGMVEDTWPGVEQLGAELLVRALRPL